MQRIYSPAKLVMLDPERTVNPISATRIRTEGPWKHWDLLPQPVRRSYIKRVVVIGTESVGKSTLVQQLATLYNTSFVKEYGRTILEEINDPYTLPEDYPIIAMQHFLDVEKATKTANKILFIDTEANVTQNFSKMYEGFHQDVVNEIAKIQKCDLMLFLSPEVDWVDDGTRVFSDQQVRERAAADLLELVRANNPKINLVHITGKTYHERFKQACTEVQKLLK